MVGKHIVVVKEKIKDIKNSKESLANRHEKKQEVKKEVFNEINERKNDREKHFTDIKDQNDLKYNATKTSRRMSIGKEYSDGIAEAANLNIANKEDLAILELFLSPIKMAAKTASKMFKSIENLTAIKKEGIDYKLEKLRHELE